MNRSFVSLAWDLQDKLDMADVFESSPPIKYSECPKPASMVLRMDPLKLKMYQETGHKLPHLHVDYGRLHHVASYSIDPTERLEGQLKSKYDATVLFWIRRNKAALLSLWNTMQDGGDGGPIIAELQR